MSRSLANWTAGQFFLLNLVYLGVLATLLIGRGEKASWVRWIQDPIGGVVPVGVPWFGALGAVMISLYGVFDWNNQWEKKWNYWHAARPLVGAVLAVVAFLIFVGLINATGAGVTVTQSKNTVNNVPYLVLAFIVGFREQTFRLLIKRAADLVLGPGIPGQTPSGVLVTATPRVARHSAGGGSPETVAIVVANSGTVAVALDKVEARVNPADAATIEVTGLEGTTVSASSHVSGEITIVTKKDASFTVVLTVSGTFGARSVTIERT